MTNNITNDAQNINLKFSSYGLIPVIVQDYYTRQVLMLAYMNQEAWQKTLATGYTWFWSRSRKALWHKGETSGHTQKIKEIFYDCDEDTLLLLVEQNGPACHTGEKSCFYRQITREEEKAESIQPAMLLELVGIIRSRLKEKPENSYVTRLTGKGDDAVLRKIGEEATELILAFKNRSQSETVGEAADLIFHSLLSLEYFGVPAEEVFHELEKRHKAKAGGSLK